MAKPSGGDDMAHLARFVQVLTELERLPLLASSGLQAQTEVRRTSDGGFEFAFRYPNENDFRSFLLGFRKLVADKEPTQISRIVGIGLRHAPSEDAKAALQARRQQQRTIERMHMGSKSGQPMRRRQTFELWCNGHYFHSAPELVAELDDMPEPVRQVSWGIMLDYVIDTLDHARWVAQWIGEGQVLAGRQQ